MTLVEVLFLNGLYMILLTDLMYYLHIDKYVNSINYIMVMQLYDPQILIFVGNLII